jgi:phenylacetate-CoA ligase
MTPTETLEEGVHSFFRRFVLWRRGVVPERYARMLARFEGLSPAARREESFRRMQAVVRHAWERVPYYRRAFEGAGFHPDALRGPADLVRVPILEKADVIPDPHALCVGRLAPGARWDATGGSTGEPLRFVRSLRCDAVTYANEARTWRWYGVGPGARQAYVWGADRDVSPDRSASDWRSRLLGIRQLNAFLLDDARCRRFAEILAEFRPTIVYGYATALARFAGFLEEQGQRLPEAPRAIRSTAEVLLPEHRAVVERAFGAPLFDYYGSREVGPIAGEAPGGPGLNVFSDVTYVEIVGEDGRPLPPGEPGDVVVTKLHEYEMPLVRYRIGDRAALLDDGQEGRGFPRLTPLEGRVGDFVTGPDGRVIHGEFFTHLFYGVAGVHRFQVVQPEPDRLEIRVAGDDVDPAALESIRARSAEHFGGGPDAVTLERVAEIRPGASGKHRFVLPYATDRSS